MLLSEIEDELPNGFHDACLSRLTLDLVQSELQILLRVDVSTKEEEERTGVRYSMIKLTLRPLQGFVLSSRGTVGGYESREWIKVDGFTPSKEQIDCLPAFDEVDARIVYGFFVQDWNSSFFVASTDVELSWLDSLDEGAKSLGW